MIPHPHCQDEWIHNHGIDHPLRLFPFTALRNVPVIEGGSVITSGYAGRAPSDGGWGGRAEC